MSLHWSDGNLAALAGYERQQDGFAARDAVIEARAAELAEDRDYRMDAFSAAIDRGELLEQAYDAIFNLDALVVQAARKALTKQIEEELLRRATCQIEDEEDAL